MLKTYRDRVRAGLVITLLSAAAVSGQEPGSLLWKTSVDWSVHDLASSGDVNGDGFADIFAGSGDNRIYCFSGDGETKGNVIWSWGVGADVWTVAVLKDVDGDGVDDCLAGAADNTVYCMTGKPTDGLTSIVWSYFAGGDIWTLSPIRDVNGDGIDDCLAGTGNDLVLCLDGAYGQLLWSFLPSYPGAIRSVTSIPDVNGDGIDDCLAGSENDRVMCISGGSSGTGDLLWSYKTGSTVLSVASVEDVNGDGKPDCFAGGEDDKIYCLSGGSSGSGSKIWSFTAGSTIKTVASLKDVNADNVQDCIAGSEGNYIYGLSGLTGSVLWSYQTGSTVLSVASIGDANGNGGENCIAGGEDNVVYCIDGKSSGTGEVLWSYQAAGTVICVSSSSDISGNGSEDVLAGSDDSFIYAIEGGEAVQEAVTAPDTPSGPSSGKVGQALTFAADGAASDLGHSVEYKFDWGDAGFSGWGASSQDHTYLVVGNYTVKAQARCQIHPEVESAWSNGMTVAVSGHILTVIVDGSGTVTPSPDKAEYNHEETVTLTANPSAENRFDRWEGAATGSEDTATIIMDGDKTVTAYFQEISELISTPAPPVLPSGGEVLEQVSCTSSGSSSNLGHEVEYRFDWGNGNQSGWGDSSRSYMWDSAGNFSVKAQARCKVHTSIVSGWSPETGITIISTDVQDHVTTGIPDRFQLFQNFPNPFNMETCIIFQIPQACDVTCDILNVQGERISRLARGHHMAGEHRMTWDGKDASGNSCPSGIYFCRLDAGKERAIKWMMLLK